MSPPAAAAPKLAAYLEYACFVKSPMAEDTTGPNSPAAAAAAFAATADSMYEYSLECAMGGGGMLE